MRIVAKRRLWYAISLIIIIPGIISLVMKPHLRLGQDFTGGTLIEIAGPLEQVGVEELAHKADIGHVTVTSSGDSRWLIRYRSEGGQDEAEAAHKRLRDQYGALGATELRYETVGPSVSGDIARGALLSVLVASIAIVLYVAFAFRNAPPPISPWSFGICAIVALLHDALLLLGIYSILGRFAGVEIDALFVTAVLTVIGFSVHDTIVVFDRVRENLRRERKPLEEVVEDSITETFARSLNTSVTVILVLFALYLFGGASIRYFVLALLIGIASGTYSSIFNASPMLVTWNNFATKRRRSG